MKSARVAVMALTLAGSARAQRAAYANPDELPPEGLPHALDVALLGSYSRVARSPRAPALENGSDVRFRSRLVVGRTVSYSAGVDAALGGSDAGIVYGLTAHALGLGARWGAGNALFVTGGVGIERFGAVPSALKLPAEVSLVFALGPVRPKLWVQPAWIPGEVRRQHGATLSDELEAGLLVRLARQHRYWSTTSAGGGLAFGFAYREFMGTYAVTGLFGLDFGGER